MLFKGILKISWQPYHALLVSSLPHSPKIRVAFHFLEILFKPWISSSVLPSLSTENTLYFKETIKIKKDLPRLSPTVHPFFTSIPPFWGWSLTACALWTTNLSCLLRNLALLFIHVLSQYKERFTHCKLNDYQTQIHISLNSTSLLLGIYTKD